MSDGITEIASFPAISKKEISVKFGLRATEGSLEVQSLMSSSWIQSSELHAAELDSPCEM